MDLLWQWRERLRRLFFKARVEREVREEMDHHLEMESRELRSTGLDEAAAARAARLRFGSIESAREEAREVRFGHGLDTFVADTRYSLRLLRRNPGFAVSAIATLAIAIGATTAVFTLVSSLMLEAMPYEDPEEVVWIQTHWQDAPSASISPAEFLDYRSHLGEVLDHVGVYSFGATTLSGEGEPLRARTAFVSGGVFPALGARTLYGRVFTESEDDRNAPLAVIGESLWSRRFGRRPDVVDRVVTLDGRPFEIVGVLSGDFRLPEEMWLDGVSEVYLPQGIDPATVVDRGSHYLSGVGRLALGASQEEAAVAIEALAARFSVDYPEDYPADMRFGATSRPLADRVRGPMRRPMLALFAGVGLLLAIACANVAGLILARSDLRRREMALRSSLGAPRGRMARQVVTESVVLGLLSGAVGLGVATLALALARRTFPEGLDWARLLRLDPGVALFAAIVAVGAGVAFGVMPALALPVGAGLTGRGEPGLGARGATASRRSQRSRSVLVAAEIALTLVLLVAAGLLAKSFAGLLAVDPGYRTTGIAATRVSLPRSDYPENADLVSFYREVTEVLATAPGVDSAGAVTNLPLATRLGDMNFRIEGREIPPGVSSPAADWQVVTPGYLEAMGLVLLEGRTLVPSDREEAPGVVVINRAFAEEHWPGESPLGARFELGGRLTRPDVVEVVGVVGDVRHADLSEAIRPQMYLAHEQFRFWGSGRAAASLELVVRSGLETAALRRLVEAAVHDVDPNLPLSEFRTMERVRRRSLALPRVLMALLGIFAASALLLAAVGVFGITAQLVSRRLPEIGIRMALGAAPRDVLRSVLRPAFVLALSGVTIGLLASLAVGRLLSGLLYGVEPTDAAVLGGVSLLLAATALLAGYCASTRAARADPASLLGSE